MAKIDITRQARAPQTASVYIRTTAVTSSLTGQYDLEFVPLSGISGSSDPAAISGSLGANATFIRALTEAKVSGSFVAASSSFSTRLTSAEAELALTLLSGSAQVKSLLPAGVVSSSAQIDSDLFNIDGLVSSSAQIATNISGAFSAPSASFSTRLTTAETELSLTLLSGSAQVKSLLPSGTISSSAQLPTGVVSSSAQIKDNISGSFTSVSSSLASRLATAETELSLTLLSGSAQVKSLLPAGTISSSTQIDSLPKMVDRTLKITNIGGANVQSLVNESNEAIPTSGQILKWNDTSNQFELGAAAAVVSLSFNDTTNALSLTPGNSVDLSSLLLSGSTGVGTPLTASVSASIGATQADLTKVLRSITFTGNAVSASNSGNALTVAINSGSSGGSTDYDGNRKVSNVHLRGLVTASFNAGTSGSISDFLDAVFFPNTSPSISSSRLTINEFETGAVGTITATDAESGVQTITFVTQSSYSADKFAINSGSGQITVKGHTTSSVNTVNRGDGVLAHPFLVAVNDGFVTSSATIFIRVTPNTAPVFRTTSAAGSIVTAQTGSVNENTTSGSSVLTFFVSDSESDTITIHPLSQSVANRFAMATSSVSGGKRIIISTVTASFDFESATQHNLFVSASDNHHGNTSGSYVTTLPIRINVTDNAAPTMGSQAFSIPEHSSSHADHGQGTSTNSVTTVGTVTTNDSEGDTVTFTALTLTSGSGKNNSNQSNPANDPFQITSAGVLQLKAAQFLNASVFNQYKYNASYKDNFNNASSSGVITINVTQEPTPTISQNSAFFIIESAVSGALVRTNSNGRTGTQGRFTSTGTTTFNVSSSGFFHINSSTGHMSMTGSVSGSAFDFDTGNAISGSVTASTAFGTQGVKDFHTSIAINNAPVPSFSNTSANLNQNGARPNNLLTTISFSDAESDTLSHSTFVFTDPSNQLSSTKVGDTYQIKAAQNLSASVYQMTASIKDNHGFRTGTTKHAITIAQPNTGTLGTNGTFYIIESAVSGALVRTNSNGRTGTQADLGVTYSPNYNSQAVASFTSSNAMVHVSNTGAVSVKQNVSGSAFTFAAGNPITSNITFRDQYNNVGSGSLSINVAINNAPDIIFTPSSPSLDTGDAEAGDEIVRISFNDAEGDTINNSSFTLLTGSHAPLSSSLSGSAFKISGQNNLTAGTYQVTASIKDNHGFRTNTENVSITVTQGASPFFFYKSTRGALGLNGTDSQAINILGDADKDGNAAANSPIAMFQSGSIGSGSINVTSGVMTLVSQSTSTTLASSGSGHSAVRQFGNIDLSGNSGNGHQFIILFPSSSVFGGKPRTLVSSFGGSVADQYVVYNDNASSDGPIGAGVHYFSLKSGVSYQGFNRWGIVYDVSPNTATNQFYHIVPASGSGPSSEI